MCRPGFQSVITIAHMFHPMTRLCVVGGGTSGSEAAREAEMRGADVTVIERLEEPDLPYVTWPNLLSRAEPNFQDSEVWLPRHRKSWNQLETEARSVRPNCVETNDGRTVKADEIVIATGCAFETVSFPGCRKPGVLVLDGMSKYSELRSVKARIDRVVVWGEGRRAVRVAEGLVGGGRKVQVIVSSWQNERPSPLVMAALERAARSRGVSFLGRPLLRAVGSASLEAIVAGGEVVPCDTLVTVPRRVPRVVPSSAHIGPRGGLLVDYTLRTDSRSFYAAGGCAELETRFGPSCTLENEPAMTGRIAGANGMGECLSVGSVRSSEEHLFGVIWSRIGIGPAAARASGLAFETTSYTRGDISTCTIVHEKRSGKVFGVEWVDAERPASPDAINLSSGISLRTLAYRSSGASSDISLVSDTARLGLARWQRS